VLAGRAAKLKGFELPAMVYLDPAPFDIERDLVTPKLSLKRPQLLKFYKQQIDAMYAELKAKVTKAAAPAGASTPVRA
jgi:long-chain acyl-CoA synthetase